MKCIDSHTHTYFRGPEDLELMSVSGVEGVVLCSYFPVQPTGASTVFDFFKFLAEEEAARLASYGIDFRLAMGIHPKFIPKYELDLAIERGELHGGGGQWTRFVSGRPDWIASGKILPFLQFGL
ncbi:MAG: hypothetical protein QHG94_05315, partial [Candidatus Methanosuratincola sp.]|nr:hypothetical protein [Candidatus Methanosuratincola sp.]